MNGRELAVALGVSEKQIYHWSKKKWLQPNRVDAGRWTGEELWFPLPEQQVARRMVALVRAGFYPDAAHKLARGYKSALSKALAALQPCLLDGEMTYRLTVGAGAGSKPPAPCAVPPLPDCVGVPQDTVAGELCE